MLHPADYSLVAKKNKKDGISFMVEAAACRRGRQPSSPLACHVNNGARKIRGVREGRGVKGAREKERETHDIRKKMS